MTCGRWRPGGRAAPPRPPVAASGGLRGRRSGVDAREVGLVQAALFGVASALRQVSPAGAQVLEILAVLRQQPLCGSARRSGRHGPGRRARRPRRADSSRASVGEVGVEPPSGRRDLDRGEVVAADKRRGPRDPAPPSRPTVCPSAGCSSSSRLGRAESSGTGSDFDRRRARAGAGVHVVPLVEVAQRALGLPGLGAQPSAVDLSDASDAARERDAAEQVVPVAVRREQAARREPGLLEQRRQDARARPGRPASRSRTPRRRLRTVVHVVARRG